LRGLIDGDGSIGIYRGQSSISIRGTKALLYSIKSKIKDIMDINASCYQDNYTYKLTWYHGCIDLGERIYREKTLYMQRKYNKFLSVRCYLESIESYRGRLTCHALKQADLKNRYIDKIKDFHSKNGRIPTANEFRHMGSNATVYKYFGSFNNLIRLAGYIPRSATKVKI